MLALLGPRGTGKTQLSAVLAYNCLAWAKQGASEDPDILKAWKDPHYIRLADLLSGAKQAFGTDRDPLGDASQWGLLILDEIGESRQSDYDQKELVRLIDRRYGALLPTIVIGNMKPEMLVATLGESSVSRLQETGMIVQCNWPSWRNMEVKR